MIRIQIDGNPSLYPYPSILKIGPGMPKPGRPSEREWKGQTSRDRTHRRGTRVNIGVTTAKRSWKAGRGSNPRNPAVPPNHTENPVHKAVLKRRARWHKIAYTPKRCNPANIRRPMIRIRNTRKTSLHPYLKSLKGFAPVCTPAEAPPGRWRRTRGLRLSPPF